MTQALAHALREFRQWARGTGVDCIEPPLFWFEAQPRQRSTPAEADEALLKRYQIMPDSRAVI